MQCMACSLAEFSPRGDLQKAFNVETRFVRGEWILLAVSALPPE